MQYVIYFSGRSCQNVLAQVRPTGLLVFVWGGVTLIIILRERPDETPSLA